jgi:hypothetical protein
MQRITAVNHWLGGITCALLLATPATGQTPAFPPESGPVPFFIPGSVKSGNTPLPGVNVVATNPAGRWIVALSEVDGGFTAVVPAAGHWAIHAEMAAFSPLTKEVVVDVAHPLARVELQMTLLVPRQRK